MRTDHLDPETRSRVGRAGGRSRAAAMTSDDRRKAAAATNSPASLARRIAKRWPELTDAERAEVRAILRAVI